MLALVFLILIALILVGCVIGLFVAEDRFIPGVGAGIAGIALVVVALCTSLYSQGVGSAKVLIDAGGKVVGYDDTPGWSAKAPWHSISNWDLFDQTVTFGGGKDGAPSYTGGDVAGQEVTATVAGGAQANVDVQVTYSLDGSKVADLYSQYRTQERFTKQIVVPSILSTIRDIPSSYKPVDFRGASRGEADQRIEDALNEALGEYGITVTLVALQDIRFTDEVEASIKNVEVAQQKEAEAQANLRATEVSAQAQVVEAQAQADANRILSESLTPELLQQRYLDTLQQVGKSGNLVIVPEGSTPFVQAPVPAPAQ